MDLEQLKVAVNLQLDDFDRQTREFERGLGRLANSAKDAGGDLTRYVTAPLLLLGGASIKVAGDIQALEKGFAAVYKGAGDVGEELKKVQEVAKLPGLGLKEAVAGSIRLQAVGISAEQARKTLLAFGNAIATTGGGKNELDRVTVQLGQLSSKGKVLSQDLRPIIEAAPIAAAALKKLYGTVDSETISAALEKAGKSSQDFISELTDELAKLPKVTGGIKNALENLSDAGTLVLAKLGDAVAKNIGLEELAEKISTQVTAIADNFAGLDPASQKVILGFAGVAAGTGPLLLAFGTAGVAIPKIVEGFKLVGTASTTLLTTLGPVGIAVAAVAAGLVYFAATNKSAADVARESAKNVADLDAKLTPLVKTYDELKGKTSLTAIEQEKLNATVKQIDQLLPGATTKWDKYGNAIDISRGKLTKLLAAQRQIAVNDAVDALPGLNADVDKAAKKLKSYQDRLNEIDRTGGFKSGKAFITPGASEVAALRKEQQKLSVVLEEALVERNATARLLGLEQQYTDENNVVRSRSLLETKSKEELKALNDAAAAKRKVSKDSLQADIKALNEKKDLLDKDTEKDAIGKINIEIAKKLALIKAIDEYGVGSKSGAKKAAKELSDLAKANQDFAVGLRQANLDFKVQGETFDVAAAKARVYKTYLDKLISLDKTGKAEDSPQFKKALEEYQQLTDASEKFQQTAKLKGIFENTEASIAATGEQVLALGKYADESVERVKLLEAQLGDSLRGVEALKKAGAGENNEYLLAERQHATALAAELEKARQAAAAVKRDANTDDLLESLNGGTGNKASTNFGDLASGKAQDELEKRIRDSQGNITKMQTDGSSEAQIKQAKDALAGLKGQLDLTDVYAGAAKQASDSLGEIGAVILDGIGGIITGQTSLTDGLASIFSKTLGIVGDFMKDFGKQLLLLGAGHVALGIATGNPAMVTAGGFELAAGGALYLGGSIVSAIGSSAAPSTGNSNSPQTSTSASPGSGTSFKDKQNIVITMKFLPAEIRLEGAQLRGLMLVDEYRLRQTR